MNGHFLRPTTSAKSISWVSTIVLGEKNLAPSKVGQTENFQTCLMDYVVGECAYVCLHVDAGSTSGGRGAAISFDQPVEPGLPVCRSTWTTCKDHLDLFTFQRSTAQNHRSRKQPTRNLKNNLQLKVAGPVDMSLSLLSTSLLVLNIALNIITAFKTRENYKAFDSV